MKKSTLFILAAGALVMTTLPVNAQNQATTQQVKKEAQKIQGNNGVTNPSVPVTTPVANPALPTAPAQAAQPVLPQVPLTCSWDITDYDFGKNVVQLKPASATFTLTNKGKDPVTITQVSTSCGCTSPKYTKEPIKPGDTGEVTLTYNAAVSGYFSKSATVTLNDGQKYPLTIKGEVQKIEQPKTTAPTTPVPATK
jgi:hypothetical protein